MMKASFLAVALLAGGRSALAQTPAGAPGQFQQIPPIPSSPKAIPDIRVERDGAQAGPEATGIKVQIQSLRVTGATQFSEAQLVEAAGFQSGRELNLGDLRALAARISEFYSRHGYFLAQAYLPAQAIENGTVTIAVVEGRYGEVTLNNSTGVSNGLARSILSGLTPGDVVENAPLERRLLLLADLPGVVPSSTLSPGASVGTSNLIVDLIPGRKVRGRLEADNAGNRYTGDYRAGGSISVNEPLGWGDVASLRVLTSGSGLTYARASYQGRIRNLTAGVAYAHLDYRLGKEFSALDATGTTDVASLYASYPVYRSRGANLNILGGLDDRRFRDTVNATSSVSERSARVVDLGLAGLVCTP